MSEYNRENYEHTQAELTDAEQRERNRVDDLLSTPTWEKLPVITYQAANEVLEYFRGKTLEQVTQRLRRLETQAQGEAVEINHQYQSLVLEVELGASALARAMQRLKEFETKVLDF